jgi:hypothetical protein
MRTAGYLLAAAVCALPAAFTAAVPALASTVAARPGARVAPPAAHMTATARAEAAASARARSVGRAVGVAALTTPDSTTRANPNGSFTTTDTAFPTRMKSAAGQWVATNASLRRTPGGAWAPVAAPGSLVLSGGGNESFATISDGHGRSVSLRLPVRLPAPQVSGATATYRNVYPGLNLVATALPTGGLSEALQATTAAGVARTATFAFRIAARGLKLTAGPDGSIKAAAGSKAVFVTAPASQPPGRPQTDHGPRTAASGRPAAGPLTSTTLRAGTLTVHSGLTGAAEHAAVTLPTWLPYVYSSYINFDEIQQGCPTYENYDNTSIPAGVGEVSTNTSCPGAYRTYFTVSTANLNSSDIIQTAYVQATELYSSADSCDEGSQGVEAWWTGAPGASTNWNHQPGVVGGPYGATTVEDVGNSDGKTCIGLGASINIKPAIVATAAANNSQLTFELTGNETSGSNTLQRFNYNPAILTTYDITPGVPANLAASPVPQTSPGVSSQGCGTQPAGYISKSAAASGSGAATLSATLTSPVSQAQLQGDYTVTDTTTGQVTKLVSATGASGASESVSTPDLTDGNAYTWSVITSDGLESSGPSATCGFTADLTAPTNPVITSTAFPPPDSSPGTTLRYGQPGNNAGTVTFTSSDPAPATGTASGLAGFYYALNGAIPASGETLMPAKGGSATVTITPPTWGTNTLNVEAVDNAGNVSGQSSYQFYLPWYPGAKITAGDINGDGIPDLVTASSAGNLLLYPGDTDPARPPTVISTPAWSPSGSSTPWSQYLITHDGSYTSGAVDDLWAFNTSTHQLYVYKNSGGEFENTTHPGITKYEVDIDGGCENTPTAPDGCASYDDSNWNELTGLVAVAGQRSLPDGLITIENGSLWYYQGQESPEYLGSPVMLGSSGWAGLTLVGVESEGVNSVLWTRTAAGDIEAYTITMGADGSPESLGTPTSPGGTTVATGFTPAAYPTVTSPGDVNGDGNPDLYAIDAAGKLWFYPGTATGAVTPAHRWALTEGSGSVIDDSSGSLNGTVDEYVGGTSDPAAAWNANPDTPNLDLDGVSGYAQTAGPAVNTGSSYTVSAWVNLDTLPAGNATAVSEFGTNNSPFYLQYNSGSWAFATSSNDTASPVINGASGPASVTAGRWYHLTGVYNASTQTASLYVDDQLVGSQGGLATWTADGDLNIGRDLYTGLQVDYFPGQISDVETYNSALTPTEVSAQDSTGIGTTPVLVGTLNAS